MENIPPITPHEFKKRFDSCITHKLHLLCHKSCHCTHLKRKAHNAEIMDLLPKKLSHLDSGSDQREVFWGLYARQMILFRRILLYNVLCISPFMWFLLMWTLKWEKGDFQNGSVLLMAMLSLLTLFWTTFIANLQLGRGAHTN